MRLPGIVTFRPGVTGPDPLTDPELVPDELVMRLPTNDGSTPLGTAVVALLADDGEETVTCEVYVLAEGLDSPAAKAERTWLLLPDTVVLAGPRQVVRLTEAPLVLGTIYLRPTNDTLLGVRRALGGIA